MELILQPYSRKLGNCLAEDLRSGKYRLFLFSVAYAKLSGVDALVDGLSAFRASGGEVHATVGIDQANTSFEALRALLALTDGLYIFHNSDDRSCFHPKTYIFAGDEAGKIYIGSNNLTEGGLFSNYEIAGCQEYDLTVPAQAEAFANAARSLNVFRQDGPCCKRAAEDLIRALYDARMIYSESELRLFRQASRPAGASEANPIFRTEPITGRAAVHDLSRFKPEAEIRAEYLTGPAASDEAAAPPAEPVAENARCRCFYKRLSRNDVDLKSSPGQIIIPIGFKSFFGKLSEPQTTPKGAMQSERYFSLKYENTGAVTDNARVIFYVPAATHARKNSEVRFAMRNRAIFNTFEKDDVLVFTLAPQSEQGQYYCSVRRIPHGDAEADKYPGRCGWISK